MTALVERLDLPSALPRARGRRDETDTVQFAQAALAAALARKRATDLLHPKRGGCAGEGSAAARPRPQQAHGRC